MIYTKHARDRMQQRGKSESDISLICKYGKRRGDSVILRKRDAATFRLRHDAARSEEEKRRDLQRLDHLIGWRIVLVKGQMITIHPLNRRVKGR